MSDTWDISTVIPDNVTSGINDDGELVFTTIGEPKVEDGKGTPAEKTATGETGQEAKTGEAAKTADPNTPVPDNFEKRYKDLQPAYTKATQEISVLRNDVAELRGQLKGMVEGNRTPVSTEPDSDLLSIEGEGDEGKLETLVTKTLAKVLGPEAVSEFQTKSSIQREFDSARKEFTDFDELAPTIKQVMAELSDLHLNFRQAYILAKRLADGNANPGTTVDTTKAQPSATTQAPKPGLTQEEADKLRTKASTLETEQGVAVVSDQKKAPKTLRDVVAASWEEVGLAS